MNTKQYIPNPIDTSDVQLPEELNPLLESMAKNVHEIWALERIKQGWTYGKKRNDAKKHHPCIVPYEELPEKEKLYDRNTSVETLKMILKLGFKISKKIILGLLFNYFVKGCMTKFAITKQSLHFNRLSARVRNIRSNKQ